MQKNKMRNGQIATYLSLSLLIPTAAISAELEEIVVTGLKRESTIMETASAITALSASDLSARGLSNIRQIQYAVPLSLIHI